MNTPIRTVEVSLGARSYVIRIGSGLLSADFGAAVPHRCLVVTDQAIADSHAVNVLATLNRTGHASDLVVVPAGETSKSSDQLNRIYDALVNMRADRSTGIIAVGGGVIGDLAGFAAATYARGIPFVQAPTTLLAMVDSSVGGKTGINHPKGKNLIGAFHQPRAVLIDVNTLGTLPDREFRSGLAEVVKYGVILDPAFFEWLENNADAVVARDPEALSRIIARSCELKAQIVEQDETETTGLRAVLNYGHTFAHAFEALAGYGTLLHGEAVSIGMLCASRLAEKMGRISSVDTARQRELLMKFNLPVDVPAELLSRTGDIIDRMMLDKKTVDGELRFILPSQIGHVETVRGISGEEAAGCLC